MHLGLLVYYVIKNLKEAFMNQSNIETLKKTRSICLLYGIVSLIAGLINFSILNEHGLGMIMVTVAILGFWRISHKVKGVMASEGGK